MKAVVIAGGSFALTDPEYTPTASICFYNRHLDKPLTLPGS